MKIPKNTVQMRGHFIDLIAVSLLLVSCSGQNPEVTESIRSLDTVIGKKQLIEDAKNQRIAQLKSCLDSSSDQEGLYNVMNDIFNEYFQYDVDSAIFYAHRKLALAMETERKDLILDAKFDIADRYVTSGMYQEALEIVSQIDTVRLGKNLHKRRNSLLNTVYSNLIDRSNDPFLIKEMEVKRDLENVTFERENLMSAQPAEGQEFTQEELDARYARIAELRSQEMRLQAEEMDEIYDLPYERNWHPMYDAAGGVPAIKEVKFSITAQRGCFGGCNFCAIISHQGRIIQPRSDESIIREAVRITQESDFKGYIHDVGGPTANFHRTSCDMQLKRGTCHGKQCLSPDVCRNLVADQQGYIELLRKLRQLPRVKKVFIRSGIRFDYLLLAKDDFLRELCEYHISGQLKIAPEHISDRVTRMMGKSGSKVYKRFVEKFTRMNQKLGKKQYLVPYFMSSHPGCHLEDAIELAEFIKEMGYHPEQVQDFIPTPGTLSTCMWYTGLNPLTGEAVYSAKSKEDKAMQRALMQFWLPGNYGLVKKALCQAGRQDLIGYGPHCLIRPEKKHKQVKTRKRLVK